MEPRPGGVFWRFSLGEILVAVAIDAVLVATILDFVKYMGVEDYLPVVAYAVLVLSFVVFPLIVIPMYFVTRAFPRRSFRAWHSRRNDVLMLLDIWLVGLAIAVVYHYNSNRTRHVQLVVLFVPIAYTLYLTYSLIVERLRRAAAAQAPAPIGVAASPFDEPIHPVSHAERASVSGEPSTPGQDDR